MLTIMIRYTGTNGSAKMFVEEMLNRGIVDQIRSENGNIRYEYFLPLDDEESVVLIDSWANQEALDIHHSLPLMKTISELRKKYDLHMKVEKYQSLEDTIDEKFVRK